MIGAPMSEAVTLPCPSCGAALPADPTSHAVTCSYCHRQAPIPADVRQRAIDHANRVAAARSRADEASRAASQLRFWSGSQNAGFVFTGVVFAVMIGAGLLASVAGPYLPKSVLPIAMPIVIYGSFIALGVGYYVRYKRRTASEGRAPLAVAASVCGRCGGPLTFVAGAASAVCQACSATAIAGRTIVRDLSAAAEQRALDMELDRLRAERQMYRDLGAGQRFGQIYMFVAMGWPVIAIGVAGIVMAVDGLVTAATSRKARVIEQGLRAVGVGSALTLVAAAVVALVIVLAVRPMLAPGRALRALAARLGGSATRSATTAAIDWLDAHWPEQTRHEIVVGQGELMRHTLVANVEGVPVLVVALAGGSKVHGPRLYVLAASRRALAHGASSSPAARELARRGFEITTGAAGVTLTRYTLDRDVMNEATMAWALGAVVAATRGR